MPFLFALLVGAQVILVKVAGEPPSATVPSGMLTAHAVKVQPR